MFTCVCVRIGRGSITQFFYTQDNLAKDLRKKAKFTKEMGKIHGVMEMQLQKLNVKRQAYHSLSFVGNHINICLKVNFA